jgi:hypothetical protein
MVLKKITPVFVSAVLIAVTTLIAFAADEVMINTEVPAAASSESAVSTIAPQEAVSAQDESDIQWAWGEVVNLDNAAKTITLKYLDYETDQEKDILLIVNEKTAFENIKGFDDIKIKDTLSIDYAVASDGKNIARNIGLESPDSSAALPAQAVEEVKKADTQTVPEQPAVAPEEVIEQPPVVVQAAEQPAQE